MAEGSKSVPSLLPLNYCTLDRAARMLGIECSDLIHLAEIGLIRLVLKFPSETKVTNYSDDLLGALLSADASFFDEEDSRERAELRDQSVWKEVVGNERTSKAYVSWQRRKFSQCDPHR
jgi:hypothetical protein